MQNLKVIATPSRRTLPQHGIFIRVDIGKLWRI